MAGPKLICGLGNPGREYRHTRHNIGFQILESLCDRAQVELRRRKFEARLGEGKIGPARVLFLEPQTFMNLSGRAVASAAEFFEIGRENALVLHDELDLPFGRLQLKNNGGGGGHNGLRSIIEWWGTKGFDRLRFGIGRPPGTASDDDVTSYVLGRFTPPEQEALPTLIEKAVEATEVWAVEGLAAAMNRFNRRSSPSP